MSATRSLVAVLLVLFLTSAVLSTADALEDCPHLNRYRALRVLINKLGPSRVFELVSYNTESELLDECVCALERCEHMSDMDQMHRNACSMSLLAMTMKMKSKMHGGLLGNHTKLNETEQTA